MANSERSRNDLSVFTHVISWLPVTKLADDGLTDPSFRCGAAGHILNDQDPMAKLRIIFENGEPERVIEFDPAKAPFHHDGQPGSILDVMLGHGVHLEHACGGNCACTTCHVVIKQGFSRLGEASEQEEDLLDRAPGLTPTSRLGCQAIIDDPDAEIVVLVPRFTINQVSESRQ
jgi:2Fe-2S ferredoxin